MIPWKWEWWRICRFWCSYDSLTRHSRYWVLMSKIPPESGIYIYFTTQLESGLRNDKSSFVHAKGSSSTSSHASLLHSLLIFYNPKRFIISRVLFIYSFFTYPSWWIFYTFCIKLKFQTYIHLTTELTHMDMMVSCIHG